MQSSQCSSSDRAVITSPSPCTHRSPRQQSLRLELLDQRAVVQANGLGLCWFLARFFCLLVMVVGERQVMSFVRNSAGPSIPLDFSISHAHTHGEPQKHINPFHNKEPNKDRNNPSFRPSTPSTTPPHAPFPRIAWRALGRA